MSRKRSPARAGRSAILLRRIGASHEGYHDESQHDVNETGLPDPTHNPGPEPHGQQAVDAKRKNRLAATTANNFLARTLQLRLQRA